jgi:alpha,alpha-trehalase
MTGRLAADWPQLARRLRHAGRVAVLTDFDGTLAPIEHHPETVRLSDRVRRALARLRARGHVVGIVSGRQIGDLRRRVGLSGLWYAGNHGFFMRSPRGTSLTLLREEEHSGVGPLTRALAQALRGVPGVRLEVKPAGVAVHYRGAPPASHRAATRAARRVAQADGLRIIGGKCVWELLPPAPVDKAVAVRTILELERRNGRELPAVFIGDDLTDEPVFSLPLALPVCVGRRRTAARYRLRSPDEVMRLLERILSL